MGVIATGPVWIAAFRGVTTIDAGPLLPTESWLGILWSLAHASMVGLLVWGVLRVGLAKLEHPIGGKSPRKRKPPPTPARLLQLSTRQQYLMLAITVADLAIAHRDLVLTAPAELFRNPVVTIEAIRRDAAEQGWSYYRLLRQPIDYPYQWRFVSKPDRLHELQLVERGIMKVHLLLPEQIAVFPVSSTFLLHDFELFNKRLHLDWGQASLESQRLGYHPYQKLGANYLLLPAATTPPNVEDWRELDLEYFLDGSVKLWASKQPPDRAWLVNRIEVASPPANSRHSTLTAKTAEVYDRLDGLGGPQVGAVVEAGNDEVDRLSPVLIAGGSLPPPSDAGACRIVHYSPHRVEVNVTADREVFLVLSDRYDTDWKAELVRTDGTTDPLEVWRTNRVMRGVQLPPGENRVVFRYRPATFYLGAAISLLTILGLTVIGIAARRRVAKQLLRPSA